MSRWFDHLRGASCYSFQGGEALLLAQCGRDLFLQVVFLSCKSNLFVTKFKLFARYFFYVC